MGKLFEDLKAGLEEVITYEKGEIDPPVIVVEVLESDQLVQEI